MKFIFKAFGLFFVFILLCMCVTVGNLPHKSISYEQQIEESVKDYEYSRKQILVYHDQGDREAEANWRARFQACEKDLSRYSPEQITAAQERIKAGGYKLP